MMSSRKFDPHSVPKPPLPAQQHLWVFGYGSLMWNPGFHYIERRPALLRGYHRRFCVYSVHYRGTHDNPGLVLGLDRGGSCRGIAFRVGDDAVPETMDYLWERELITPVYTPKLLPLRTDQGQVIALCFVVRRDARDYHAERSPDRTARIIRHARGSRGANLEYLANTVARLEELGMPDYTLRQLLNRVED